MRDVLGAGAKPLTIASLWIGQKWSFLEQIVAQSYLDAGHRFILFGDVRPPSLPSEIAFEHYADVIEPPFPVGDGQYHNNGVFSDLFRLILIRDFGFCWVDMDAYCVRHFDFAGGSYVMAPEVGDVPMPYVATGVLHLPRASPSLDACISAFYDENPDLPWQAVSDAERAKKARSDGVPFRIEMAKWATSGPYLLSHYLSLNDELHHAMPMTYFYGGQRSRRRPFMKVPFQLERIEVQDAYSVHFYGRTRRYLRDEYGGLPPKGSYLDLLCRRHGVVAEKLALSQ